MNILHTVFCRSDFWKDKLAQGLPWVLEGVPLGANVLEIGPGPGFTTEIIKGDCDNLTVLEIDPKYVKALKEKFKGDKIRVFEGDATKLPLPDKTFSSVVAFTMLHHIPTQEMQNKVFKEAFRILNSGGFFIASDSCASPTLKLFHLFDNYNPIDPKTINPRLEKTGFANVRVETIPGAFCFSAQKIK